MPRRPSRFPEEIKDNIRKDKQENPRLSWTEISQKYAELGHPISPAYVRYLCQGRTPTRVKTIDPDKPERDLRRLLKKLEKIEVDLGITEEDFKNPDTVRQVLKAKAMQSIWLRIFQCLKALTPEKIVNERGFYTAAMSEKLLNIEYALAGEMKKFSGKVTHEHSFADSVLKVMEQVNQKKSEEKQVADRKTQNFFEQFNRPDGNQN